MNMVCHERGLLWNVVCYERWSVMNVLRNKRVCGEWYEGCYEGCSVVKGGPLWIVVRYESWSVMKRGLISNVVCYEQVCH